MHVPGEEEEKRWKREDEAEKEVEKEEEGEEDEGREEVEKEVEGERIAGEFLKLQPADRTGQAVQRQRHGRAPSGGKLS